MDNGPQLEQVFLSFEHGQCFGPNPGEQRFVCDGRSIVIHCNPSENGDPSWILGVGKASVLWSRFFQLDLNQYHATLHTRDSNNVHDLQDDQILCDRPQQSTMMCTKTTSVFWERPSQVLMYGKKLEVSFYADNSNIILPADVFADMQQHITDGALDSMYFNFDWGDWRLRCGENCLWSKRFMSSFVFHASIGPPGKIVLNERFLQNHLLVYNADAHALHLEPFPFAERSPSWKLFSQLFIIFKLVTAVWVGTCHTSSKGFQTYSGCAFASIVLLESYVIQYNSMTSAEFLLLGFLFGAFVVFGNPTIYLLFTLQSVLRDLDSFECIVLLVTIQIILLSAFFACGVFTYALWDMSFALFTTFFLATLNYNLWILLFFEQVGSLLGSSRVLLGMLYLLVIIAIAFEWFQRSKCCQTTMGTLF